MVNKSAVSVFSLIVALVLLSGIGACNAQGAPQGDLRVVVESLGNETLDQVLFHPRIDILCQSLEHARHLFAQALFQELFALGGIQLSC